MVLLKRQLLQGSMSPGKQRLHIKISVDDTVLFRVVQVRFNSDGNTSNSNSQLRIQIKYFHRAIWMSISFGTKHKVWKRSEPDLAGTNKSSKMELYKRPRIIFTTLYTLLSTYKENTGKTIKEKATVASSPFSSSGEPETDAITLGHLAWSLWCCGS